MYATMVPKNYTTYQTTKKDFFFTCLLIATIGILIGVAISCAVVLTAQAEETDCWVLCQPDDYVNIRSAPRKSGIISGYAVSGMKLTTDLVEKNGYIHVLGVTEYGDGWISSGYVVFSEPRTVDREMVITGRGRVACRKTVDGKRRAWAKPGERLMVYMMTGDWAVTSKGFIMAEYLGDD